MEEVDGERALTWVRERNSETVASLATGSRFDAMNAEIREVLDSAEKIPSLHWRGEHLYNFWQDELHPRGLWRRATLDGVRADEWQVLLDLDALAAAEGENWVWAGADALKPDNRRYLVHLSRGGADAAVVREFDLETGFVPGGFELPEAKSIVSWIDVDHIFVATDFGPRVVDHLWIFADREAVEARHGAVRCRPDLDAGELDDVRVWRCTTRNLTTRVTWSLRRIAFFDSETYVLGPADETIRVDVPTDAEVDLHRDWLLVRLRTPWTVEATTYPAGALLAAGVDAFLGGDRRLTCSSPRRPA